MALETGKPNRRTGTKPGSYCHQQWDKKINCTATRLLKINANTIALQHSKDPDYDKRLFRIVVSDYFFLNQFKTMLRHLCKHCPAVSGSVNVLIGRDINVSTAYCVFIYNTYWFYCNKRKFQHIEIFLLYFSPFYF